MMDPRCRHNSGCVAHTCVSGAFEPLQDMLMRIRAFADVSAANARLVRKKLLNKVAPDFGRYFSLLLAFIDICESANESVLNEGGPGLPALGADFGKKAVPNFSSISACCCSRLSRSSSRALMS